jgi:hypothetical protein
MAAAVGIAQLVEHRTVAPTVAGSIPVSHPRNPASEVNCSSPTGETGSHLSQ